MANPKDEDLLALYPITENVGPDVHHLTPSPAGVAPAFRKFRKAIGGRDQPFRQMRCRCGIEGRDVGENRFEVSDRFIGP